MLFLTVLALLLAACQSPPLNTAAPFPTDTLAAATPDSTATALSTATETSSPTTAPTQVPQETETPVATETGLGPTPGAGDPTQAIWQAFNDLTYGFSFAFPPEWELCQANQYSYLFCEPVEGTGLGPPPSLYVSTIPQGFTNAEFEVYNFLPDEAVRAFLALPVGESLVFPPNAQPAEYFTYTRLPDTTVGGLTAAVIENTRVWEAPPEVKERRALVVTDEQTYMVGTYYETPEQLALFEQVLATFRFSTP